MSYATAPKPDDFTTTEHWNLRCSKCKRVERRTVTRQHTHHARNDHAAKVTYWERTSRIVAAPEGARLAGYGRDQYLVVECCNRPMTPKRMSGVYRPDVPCSAKCMSSKGHTCECSCGGKNHGSAYAV